MILDSILDCDLLDLTERALDAYPESAPLSDFGPYRIAEDPIGSGGMGEVYSAYDEIAGRHVAIKFLRTVWAEPDMRVRFDQEIKFLAKLEHPYIARLYDVGLHPSGTPYFVMEFVDGKPLDQFCRDEGWELGQRLRLFRAICEAAQYAHSHLILHRDLKPSNILVKTDGTPKLLDFGIAKQLENSAEPVNQTRTEARFTRAYAAPEQLRMEQVGVYTDVYSLGVILYELLGGCSPYSFDGCTPGQGEWLITGDREPIKPSQCAGKVAASRSDWKDLDVLCLKALKKDPARRYHSVTELIQDIDRYMNHEPLRACTDGIAYRARKFVARNRKLLLASVAAMLVIATLVSFYTWRLAQARNTAVAETVRTKTVQQFLVNLFDGGDPAAGPANDVKALTLLDRGAQQLPNLRHDPALQADLEGTIGTIYRQLGRLDDADRLLRASLGQRRSVEITLALSELRIDQAKLPDAEKLARNVLSETATASQKARATTLLARVFEERGQYDRALNILSPLALQSSLDATADHADTLDVIGDAHFYLSQYPDAQRLYLQARNMTQTVFSARHPRVAGIDIDLGNVAIQNFRYKQAENYYRDAFSILQNWYGKNHPLTARAETYVGQALGWQGRFAEDRHLLKDALRIMEASYGPDHPRVALVESALGFADLELNHPKDAEADFLRMAAIYRATYGENHQDTAIAVSNLGSVYMRQKQYARAEPLLREAVNIDRKVLPPGALNESIAELRLGRALLFENRYSEAESYMRHGYDAVKRQADPSAEYLQTGARDLIKIYTALNEPENAARFRADLTSSVNHAAR